jgi:hypothetical protein
MFGSYLVELILGLSFLFAVLGMVTTAITETLLAWRSVRAQHLKEWLGQWAATVGVNASDITQHPLLATHRRGKAAASYLHAPQFAAALLQHLDLRLVQASAGKDLASAEAAVRASIGQLKEARLQAALLALLDTAAAKAVDGNGLAGALQAELAMWLEGSMQRVEGWTKRHAKLYSMAVALALCAAFNVDALHVLRVLSTQTDVRSQLASAAVDYAPKSCEQEFAKTEERLACINREAQRAVGDLGELSRLGIGWEQRPAWRSAEGLFQPVGVLLWVVGVLVSAFAASLGGDFWFKWIGDVVRLTGYRPRLPGGAANPPPPPANPGGDFLSAQNRK